MSASIKTAWLTWGAFTAAVVADELGVRITLWTAISAFSLGVLIGLTVFYWNETK